MNDGLLPSSLALLLPPTVRLGRVYCTSTSTLTRTSTVLVHHRGNRIALCTHAAVCAVRNLVLYSYSTAEVDSMDFQRDLLWLVFNTRSETRNTYH